MKKVAIIGAGVCGLASVRRAVEYGLDAVVFEEKDHIGGLWKYSEETGGGSSPIYANLRTNLPVQLMEYRDFAFEAESGLCYPPHSDVLKYLNDFADHFELRKFIQFETSVVNVERLENDWRVTVKNKKLPNSSPVQYLFDAVMVCNGHYTIPNIPYFPGQRTFSGQIIHCRDYRRHDPFEGRRVLIVGNGPSSMDIASECCKVAKEVTLSYWSDESKVLWNRSKLTVKPAIKNIEHGKVSFVDDTSICVDVILLCTGYFYDISFLDGSCGLHERDGKIIQPLFHKFINIMEPSMCLIGLPQKTFVLPLVDLQAEVFVKHLCGLIQLPDRDAMSLSQNEEISRMEKEGIPSAHYFHLKDEREYCTRLSDLGDAKPFPPVFFKIYRRNGLRQKQPFRQYLMFRIIDDDTFVCWDENSSPSEPI